MMHTWEDLFDQQFFRQDVTFSSFRVTEQRVHFSYMIGEKKIETIERFSCPISPSYLSRVQQLVFHLGLARLFSLTQQFIPNRVVVNAGMTSINERSFWERYVREYSMELYAKLELPLNLLPVWEWNGNVVSPTLSITDVSYKPRDKMLLGVGGGKDSVVAFELLKASGLSTDVFYSAHNQETQSLRQTLSQLMVGDRERILSVQFDEYFKEGFVRDIIKKQRQKGVIPASPAVCPNVFRMAIIALSKGYRIILAANEKSADEGNLLYEGLEVNHQFGKSFVCEKMLSELIFGITQGSLVYCSLLKPAYEIRIARAFRRKKVKRYLGFFTSCNRSTTWCCRCPKCAFVYTLMAAFVESEELRRVIPENLFDRQDLLPTFRELMGLEGHKPFECVGEKEEMWLACAQCVSRRLSGTALDEFRQRVQPSLDMRVLKHQYFSLYDFYGKTHMIPSMLMSRLCWDFL